MNRSQIVQIILVVLSMALYVAFTLAEEASLFLLMLISFILFVIIQVGYIYIGTFYTKRKSIKKIIRAIFHNFFIELKPNVRYRITCYKRTKWYDYLFYRVRNNIYIYFSEQKKKTFKPIKSLSSYLVCFERYEYSDNEFVAKKSSTSFLINEKKQIYEGFAGKIYQCLDNIAFSLNNHEVNKIISNIKGNLVKNYYKISEDRRFETLNKSIKSVAELRNERLSNTNEIDTLISFMNDTNTNLFHTLNIRDHATHFLGFRFYKKPKTSTDRKPWGIVIIDVLDDTAEKDFTQYVRDDLGEYPDSVKWIKLLLEQFAVAFSNFIDPGLSNDRYI